MLEVFDGTGIPNNAWVKGKLEETLIAVKNCSIPDVNAWLSFDTPPKAGQEILIVWETFPPEKRILTEEDLKQDWTGMRWLPIPAWR